jgi:hypothetical protein
MTYPWAALALALASAGAPAAELLQPGIYRLDPDAWRQAAPAIPAAGEAFEQRLDHAVPASAKVRVAFVSRDPQRLRNTLVFVTDPGYRYDINSENRLCPAYAFPDWNDRSDARPYCRTNINGDGSEAAFDWSTTQFTVRWNDRKRSTGTERIPPQRKPTADEAGACAISDVCAPEAYGRSIAHYEVTHRRDGFVLQQARDYTDVLYVPIDVVVQTEPSVSSAGEPLKAGSYVAVVSRTPAWFQIERIASDGSIASGWIDRDALSRPAWIAQTATTPAFRFRLGVERGEGDDEQRVLSAIEVLDASTGKRVQILRDFDADPIGGAGDVLQLVDADFDGHPDILVPGMSGGAGPNSTDTVFLFDPASRTFVYDATLSGLPQLSINAAQRTVTSSARNGCCAHASDTYRYRDGSLELLESWEEALSADGESVETTRGVLRNGRMTYSTVRSPAER